MKVLGGNKVNSNNIIRLFSKINFIAHLNLAEVYLYAGLVILLSFYIAFSLYNFFIWGEYIILNIKFISFTAVFPFICFLIGFISKINIKEYIEKFDVYLRCSDRMSACYDILYLKKNWVEWQDAIINDTNCYLSGIEIRLNKVFPHKFPKIFYVTLLLMVFIFAMILFSRSCFAFKWQFYKYGVYTSSKIMSLNKSAEKLEKTNSGELADELLLQINKVSALLSPVVINGRVKTIMPKQIIIDELNKLNNLLKINSKNIHSGLYSDLFKDVNGISGSLRKHWGKVENAGLDKTGRVVGDGVGSDYGGLFKDNIPDSVSIRSIDKPEMIEIMKSGGFSSLSKKPFKKNRVNTGVGDNLKSKQGFSVNNDYSEYGNSNQNILNDEEYIKSYTHMSFNGDYTKNNVWLESVPANRRDCVKRYFSFQN